MTKIKKIKILKKEFTELADKLMERRIEQIWNIAMDSIAMPTKKKGLKK